MKKIASNLLMVSFIVGLSACSSDGGPINRPSITDGIPPNVQTATVFTPTGEPAPIPAQPLVAHPLAAEGVLGGSLARSMDSLDKSKMITALDKGIGKSSTWSNPITNTDYTVTPIKKVSIQGNTCREYAISAERNDRVNKFIGTACLGEDGNWKQISSS